MKRNFWALGAVILAIAISSFTSKVDTTFYYIYSGTGDEFTKSNFTEQTTQPNAVAGTGILNWLKVVDHNDGSVTQPEFNTASTAFDSNTNGTLNDESDISGSLDIKSNL